MINGFYSGHMAVERRGGEWVLRARMANDLPVDESPLALEAMRVWKSSNAARFQEIVHEQ